jgi:hypothetical protein
MTQVTRELIELAERDWIEWSGGECPIDLYAFAEVRFRGGDRGIAPALHWIDRWSNAWEHKGPCRSEDIIAYRVVTAAALRARSAATL